MRRALLVLVAVVCCWQESLRARGPTFTVAAVSAAVHLAPSVASPVIGNAPKGTVLMITRELGSWVKVTWDGAADGVGYLHVSTGTTTGGSVSGVTGLSPTERARIQAEDAPAVAADATVAAADTSGYVAPPAHVVGVGGAFGSTAFGSGLNSRAWFSDLVGAQVEFTTSGEANAPATSTLQIGASVLVGLPGALTDYVWVRPYLGAGPRWLRSSGPSGTASTSSVAFQAFGGGEFTFAALPRLGISADLRYGWVQKDEMPSSLGGVGVGLAAHWYLR